MLFSKFTLKPQLENRENEPALNFPLAVAFFADLTRASRYSFAADGWYANTGNSLVGSGTMVIQAAASVLLDGANYLARSILTNGSVTASDGSVLNLSATSTEYFNPTSFLPALIMNDHFYVSLDSLDPPISVTIGDQGDLAMGYAFSDYSQNNCIGSIKRSYQILKDRDPEKPENPNVLIRILTKLSDTNYGQTLHSTTTYQLNREGWMRLLAFEEHGFFDQKIPYNINRTFSVV